MIKRLLILIILLIAAPCLGADVYIDPTAGSGGDGSFVSPFDSWADVDLSVANDYRQKCGTTETLSAALTITAVGSSGNHIIIGAYNADGSFEDSNPLFGATCRGGSAKPIIDRGTVGTGSVFTLTYAGSQYIEVNSIRMQDGETVAYINSSYNTFKYCYAYNFEYGWRIGLLADADYNMIEYNYIDHNDDDGTGGLTGDSIRTYIYAQNNTAQYNHIQGFDHAALYNTQGDNNIFQYNYVYGSAGSESECMNNGWGNHVNTWRYNFCEDAGVGIEINGSSSGVFYNNLMTCAGGVRPSHTEGQGCIILQTGNAYNANSNKIYNNVVYNSENYSTSNGLQILRSPGATGDVESNEIYNNIFLKISGYCIRWQDATGATTLTEASNIIKNNSCYDYDTNKYAGWFEFDSHWVPQDSNIYTTATAFNAADANIAGNRQDDPGLHNPASYEFWPDSTSDPVYDTGYDLAGYKTLLGSNSDFTASPPSVNIIEKASISMIGAYALSTNYYIDLDDAGTGSAGTIGDPWSWADFVGATISANNDYYFLCGSDVTISTGASAGYTLSVSGNSEEDKIVFGAYYGSGTIETGTFGKYCGNASEKPKLTKDNYTAAIFNQGVGVNYIELNSLQFINGEAATYVDGNYNTVKYCYIDGPSWGVKVGGSASSQYAYIGYNYINAPYDYASHSKDAIAVYSYGDYSTVEYNIIDGTGHAAIAVYNPGTTNVTVQYNYILDTNDDGSECILLSSSFTSARYNWCEDAGIIQVTGHDNYVYGNIINGINDRKTDTGAINVQPIGYNNYNNIITNNTIYFDGTQGASIRGIYLQEPSDSAQILENNVIANNIILNSNVIPFLVYDPYGQIESNSADEDVNVWYNNLAYNFSGGNIASIEGSAYATATLWNTNYDAASGNRDDDPGLSNLTATPPKLWPDSTDDAVYNAGYDLGSSYDDLLDYTSDFTASPPSVVIDENVTVEYIGAYAVEGEGSNPTVYPLQGVAGNFKYN